jgi:hypothetical protein
MRTIEQAGLVDLVCLVHPISFIQPKNQTNKINKKDKPVLVLHERRYTARCGLRR